MIKGGKEPSLPSEKCLVKQELTVQRLLLCVQRFPDCIWEKTRGESEEKIGLSEKRQWMKRQNIYFVVIKTPHDLQVIF